ncbi:MAG: carboxylating nicotinate-nucleotide diphosphorylase [Deltaproteobacteria bacterium]|nr:carboxylating nicotinate-nucleotide diphosphorylase [Deltaproteobacteria bacterium]
MPDHSHHAHEEIVRRAIAEDLGAGDITTDPIVPPGRSAAAEMIAKEDFVLAGINVAREVFRQIDPALRFEPLFDDGSFITPGSAVAVINGSAAPILRGERVALNFLQHLSGVATVTAAFVRRVEGLAVSILETRKTLPGLRALEKYAVRVGGGTNHRMGLYDAVLIKDNHIAVAGGISAAVESVRKAHPDLAPVEVEVTDLEEVREALDAGADIILLDNMDPGTLRAAVNMVRGRALTEASGNITLENVRAVAETGVDRISVGALTHSVRAVDISLKISL